eukprot:m.188254 g.188254  ORF g.188254 m.188254 type:complete len:174 (+) comp18521_c1_seq4:254-775(+)
MNSLTLQTMDSSSDGGKILESVLIFLKSGGFVLIYMIVVGSFVIWKLNRVGETRGTSTDSTLNHRNLTSETSRIEHVKGASKSESEVQMLRKAKNLDESMVRIERELQSAMKEMEAELMNANLSVQRIDSLKRELHEVKLKQENTAALRMSTREATLRRRQQRLNADIGFDAE